MGFLRLQATPLGTAEKIVRSSFAAETGGDILEPWPTTADRADSGFDCAVDMCRYSAHGRTVTLVTAETALPVKCGGVDAIVSQVPAGFRCRSLIPVIDRIDSWRRGAIALWLGREGITLESVNERRGDRPWVPHPRSRRDRLAAGGEER
jgi:hypothetical protein